MIKLRRTQQQSFPKLHCNEQNINKGKKGHSFGKFFLFIVHFSVGILLVVHWPNHGPGFDVEQGASRAWGALTAIFPGCERVAHYTGQVWD